MSFKRYGDVAKQNVEQADVIKAWEDEIDGQVQFAVTAHDLLEFLKEKPFEAMLNEPDWIRMLVHFVYAYEKDICTFCGNMSRGMYLTFIGYA